MNIPTIVNFIHLTLIISTESRYKKNIEVNDFTQNEKY
jgi:hypothetical protein